jgi:hypothetical protein
MSFEEVLDEIESRLFDKFGNADGRRNRSVALVMVSRKLEKVAPNLTREEAALEVLRELLES